MPFVGGSLFCSRCGGLRRIRIGPRCSFDTVQSFWGPWGCFTCGEDLHTPMPAAFTYICTQCDASWSALVFESNSNPQIAVFSCSDSGGLASPNTPPGVAFYLDQAARCHSVSAHSAAITMFRSAIEWLLEDQGFAAPMLGPKLTALFKAINSGTAPKWASELNPEFLTVIKNLGNTAAHTNAGDLAKQDQLDATLYRNVETTFIELLEVIYERPKQRQQRLADLKKSV
jgi:hypothetical protein